MWWILTSAILARVRTKGPAGIRLLRRLPDLFFLAASDEACQSEAAGGIVVITPSKSDALLTTFSSRIPLNCEPIIRDSLETSAPRVTLCSSSVDRREHFPRHVQLILSYQ